MCFLKDLTFYSQWCKARACGVFVSPRTLRGLLIGGQQCARGWTGCCQVTGGQGVCSSVNAREGAVGPEGYREEEQRRTKWERLPLCGHYWESKVSFLGSSRNILCSQPCSPTKECLHFCCSSARGMGCVPGEGQLWICWQIAFCSFTVTSLGNHRADWLFLCSFNLLGALSLSSSSPLSASSHPLPHLGPLECDECERQRGDGRHQPTKVEATQTPGPPLACGATSHGLLEIPFSFLESNIDPVSLATFMERQREELGVSWSQNSPVLSMTGRN